MSSNDTIAAIATAPGTGGIGVVRVSGKKTKIIAERIIGELPPKRTATTRTFINAAGDSLDAGLRYILTDLIPTPVRMYWNYRAMAAQVFFVWF